MECFISLPDAYRMNMVKEMHRVMTKAASEGDLAILQKLISVCSAAKCEVSDDLVGIAAKSGHLDMVRFLCDLDASYNSRPDGNENLAIHTAAEHGRTDVVDFLALLARRARRGPVLP